MQYAQGQDAVRITLLVMSHDDDAGSTNACRNRVCLMRHAFTQCLDDGLGRGHRRLLRGF